MLVRTLKTHYNEYGKKYEKTEGTVYDHPSPKALLKRKAVEDATVQKAAKAPAKKS